MVCKNSTFKHAYLKKQYIIAVFSVIYEGTIRKSQAIKEKKDLIFKGKPQINICSDSLCMTL